MRIPFYKPSIGNEEIAEVVQTLQSGWLTTGPRTKQFEREFAEYLRQKHAIAVNSCTAALHLALEACGLKAGQGVVVPTVTFAATAEVVRYFGAKPLLADCRPDDLNLDVGDAETRIQSALATGQSIAAIMPVHYGGQVGDVSSIQALARRYHLKIIEDAAHCCPAYYRMANCQGRDNRKPGAELAEKEIATRKTKGAQSLPNCYSPPGSYPTSAGWLPVGSSADIACFSFYANKAITTGEGGMACTENDEYAERMRIMSLHGISRDAWKRFTAEGSWYYEIIAPGFKYNMTDIAAAIGLHQLRKADDLHRKRSEWAALYSTLLGDVDELILPRELPDRIHSWHLYAVRLKLDKLSIGRAEVIEALKSVGIGTSVHWMPLHQHPYYRETYGYRPDSFPVATRIFPELITLPLYPDMTANDICLVAGELKQILARHLRRIGVRVFNTVPGSRRRASSGFVTATPRGDS